MQKQPRCAIERLLPRHLVHAAVVPAQHGHANAVVGDAALLEPFAPLHVATREQRGFTFHAQPERTER
jgi:hypothetical protein